MTIVNLKNINGMQHWTPVTITDGGATIFYGDSFGEPIPKKLHDTYTWWIRKHGYTGPIMVKSLPIGHQTDGSSCGTFAINSLRHFLNPASVRGTPNPPAEPRRPAEPTHRLSRLDAHQHRSTAPPSPPTSHRRCPSLLQVNRLTTPTPTGTNRSTITTGLYVPPHLRTLRP